jgi:hypothetical protein
MSAKVFRFIMFFWPVSVENDYIELGDPVDKGWLLFFSHIVLCFFLVWLLFC